MNDQSQNQKFFNEIIQVLENSTFGNTLDTLIFLFR